MNKNKLFAVLLAGLMIFCAGMFAQDSKSMTLRGNYGKGEGESKGVFAAGSVVYYGLGNKVQIASFSNPASPVKIGSVIVSDVVEDLVRTSINGVQYLVATGGTKMWLINVQNPTTPSLVSTVEVATGTTAEGVATSGTYAYVAGGGAGFKIYNIATPATPALVSSIDSLAYCESVVISGQYAYVAAGTRSHIVDITNPATPLYIGKIAGYGGYHQYINVRAGYAYVCNYDASLSVVNVTNPASPVNVVDLPSGYRTARIVFDGNYGYVAVGDTGMVVYNVVNPAAPVLTSKIKTTGRAASMYYGAITIGGTPTGHIFIANRNPAPGVSAINVSNPAVPVTSAFLAALAAPTGTAYVPFYENGKAYIAYGTAGLRIVDVSNPSSPSLLSTAVLGGDSRAVVASGNYAYVAARDSGVFIVDVTNPSSPVKIKTIKTLSARGIAISGTKVYVAASDSGMVIIDITNPSAASIIAYTGKTVYGENVAVNGNTAGVSDYSYITFYDVTTPSAPVKKGTTTKFRIGNEGFAIAGNYAYVPDGDSLKIFDITNLQSPAQISKIKTGGYGYTASLSGKFCYVASEGTGVRAIDISIPAIPTEAGYYDGVPQSRGVMADGKYAYVAEKTDGMSIYLNDLFPSPALAVNKTIVLGNVKINQFKDSVVTITNSGTDTLKITSITSSSALFTVRPISKVLPPGQSFTDTIRFAPVVVGEASASIAVVSNAPTSPDSIAVSGTAIPSTGVTELNSQIPTVYSLSQNFPNPFNPTTMITFGLPEAAQVTLEVYNLLGQRVSVLLNHQMSAGMYNIPFTAVVLPSGMYLYRLQANNFTSVHKMMLLK